MFWNKESKDCGGRLLVQAHGVGGREGAGLGRSRDPKMRKMDFCSFLIG